MTCVVSANLRILHIDIFDVLYKWNNAFSYALGNLMKNEHDMNFLKNEYGCKRNFTR